MNSYRSSLESCCRCCPILPPWFCPPGELYGEVSWIQGDNFRECHLRSCSWPWVSSFSPTCTYPPLPPPPPPLWAGHCATQGPETVTWREDKLSAQGFSCRWHLGMCAFRVSLDVNWGLTRNAFQGRSQGSFQILTLVLQALLCFALYLKRFSPKNSCHFHLLNQNCNRSQDSLRVQRALFSCWLLP